MDCLKMKVNGVWEEVEASHPKMPNGTWGETEDIFRKVGGAWEEVCASAQLIQYNGVLGTRATGVRYLVNKLNPVKLEAEAFASNHIHLATGQSVDIPVTIGWSVTQFDVATKAHITTVTTTDKHHIDTSFSNVFTTDVVVTPADLVLLDARPELIAILLKTGVQNGLSFTQANVKNYYHCNEGVKGNGLLAPPLTESPTVSSSDPFMDGNLVQKLQLDGDAFATVGIDGTIMGVGDFVATSLGIGYRITSPNTSNYIDLNRKLPNGAFTIMGKFTFGVLGDTVKRANALFGDYSRTTEKGFTSSVTDTNEISAQILSDSTNNRLMVNTVPVSIVYGVENHYAIRYNGNLTTGSLSILFNGIEQVLTLDSKVGNFTGVPQDFNINCGVTWPLQTYGAKLEGTVDQIELYDRYLTDDEILLLSQQVSSGSIVINGFTQACRTTLQNTNYGLSNFALVQDASGVVTNLAPPDTIQGATDGRYAMLPMLNVIDQKHLIPSCLTLIDGDQIAVVDTPCPPSAKVYDAYVIGGSLGSNITISPFIQADGVTEETSMQGIDFLDGVERSLIFKYQNGVTDAHIGLNAPFNLAVDYNNNYVVGTNIEPMFNVADSPLKGEWVIQLVTSGTEVRVKYDSVKGRLYAEWS